jgi:hypothetical protein
MADARTLLGERNITAATRLQQTLDTTATAGLTVITKVPSHFFVEFLPYTSIVGRWYGVVGTVTRLRVRRPTVLGSISGRGNRSISSPNCPAWLQLFFRTGSGGPPRYLFSRYHGLFLLGVSRPERGADH